MTTHPRNLASTGRSGQLGTGTGTGTGTGQLGQPRQSPAGTAQPSLPRRSLQARLTLFYATGIYLAGIGIIALVAVPLTGMQRTTDADSSTPGVVTGTGEGIGPHQFAIGSVVALVLLVPIAWAAGWFVAGRFLKPLRAVTATAKAISVGNLHQRLDLGEPTDELTELGSILDDLFARLEASFTAQRHFVANASHELRTPVAGLRTLLEVALADPGADAATLRSVCQEALALGEHQQRLIHALLALATSERGITRWDTVDLAELVAEVLVPHRDLNLVKHLAPAVTAGDARLLESLTANLIDNAIRHNLPGGRVDITTQTVGAEAILTVTNTGPVVPEDQLQRLFQPFQRLAPDRSSRRDGHDGPALGHDDALGHGHGGHGLGLAIVTAVATAHHATLTALPHPTGGLTITIRFPHHSQT